MKSIPAKMLFALLRCYWWITRPVTLGVKVLLLNSQQELLLVRHTYQPGWHLPGGKVDRGESFSEAAARELQEEVGLRATIEPQHLVAVFANFADFKSDHVALYHISERQLRDGLSGKLKPQAWEISEAAFFPVSALPEGVSAATRRRVQELLGGVDRSASW